MVDAWAAHKRALAASDASPAALATLFAHPYPPGGAQYRGCSTPPAGSYACVWRVGNQLLSLAVSSFAGGFGVTAAIFEG